MNVSFEDDIKPPINSNDQLYHIIRANSFAFCLICLEDISNSSEDVGKHLGSENHQENIKRLFKACNPNLPIDNDEKFVDLVSRSVFDISVLLGEETCYICERDGKWFCIMCDKNITKSNNSDSVIKDEMIDHVLGEAHVNKTKAVCFIYKLNSDQDFLLLHKSVVYCSVCKDVIQCREVDLLVNALTHLKAKRHQELEKLSCFERESYSSVKKEQVDRDVQMFKTGTVSDDWKDAKNEPINNIVDEIKAETIIEEPHCINGSVFELGRGTSKHDLKLNLQDFEKSFNENEFCKEYSCTCLLCKRKIKYIQNSVTVSIDDHFKVNHPRIYYKRETLLESWMDSVIFHNDPDQIQIIKNSVSINPKVYKLFRKEDPLAKKQMKYIFFRNKRCCFCIVCMVKIPLNDNAEKIFENLWKHFNSSEHQQYENEKFVINRAFKAHENDATIRNVSKSNLFNEIKCEAIDEPCFNKDRVKETSGQNLKSNLQLFGKSFDEYEICKTYICSCLLCKKQIKGIKGGFVSALEHHFRSNHLNLYVKPKTSLRSFLDNVVFNKPPVNHIIPQSLLVTEQIKKLYKKNQMIKKDSKYIFSCDNSSCFCIACMFDMPLSDKPAELFDTLLSHFLSPDHLQCVEEQMSINQAFKFDENNKTVKKLTRRKKQFVQRERERKAKRRKIKQQKKLLALKKKEEKVIIKKLTNVKFEENEENTSS